MLLLKLDLAIARTYKRFADKKNLIKFDMSANRMLQLFITINRKTILSFLQLNVTSLGGLSAVAYESNSSAAYSIVGDVNETSMPVSPAEEFWEYVDTCSTIRRSHVLPTTVQYIVPTVPAVRSPYRLQSYVHARIWKQTSTATKLVWFEQVIQQSLTCRLSAMCCR